MLVTAKSELACSSCPRRPLYCRSSRGFWPQTKSEIAEQLANFDTQLSQSGAIMRPSLGAAAYPRGPFRHYLGRRYAMTRSDSIEVDARDIQLRHDILVNSIAIGRGAG